MDNISEEKLVELLKEAEKAHAAYKKKLGHRDEHWPEWYASFITDSLDTSQENNDSQ